MLRILFSSLKYFLIYSSKDHKHQQSQEKTNVFFHEVNLQKFTQNSYVNSHSPTPFPAMKPVVQAA